MTHQDLELLKQLTNELPQFPQTTSRGRGYKRHKMICGNSLSWNLDPDSGQKSSIAKWFNSPGSFPEHRHDAREWIIVIEGSMFITVEGQSEKRLLPGQSVVIEPLVTHFARFIEDCWYYAITVPHEPNWPTDD